MEPKDETKKPNRFADMQAVQKAVSSAPLTTNDDKRKKATKKLDRMVYAIDPELFEAIENSSETFSGFAKRAMEKLAKEEGKI
ncbi:hypothetical protein [Sulfuricurvum sp.]|uniref:hypothetical protein n=1 Tax=Sulfuricurvum sp. TaxID=2025608 RepID=UPI00261DBDF9|nr:hypothetical protein [Sulfuricurvum sp.]MDD3597439.1 hypothetical protein [Sulfuricurvum sp.]